MKIAENQFQPDFMRVYNFQQLLITMPVSSAALGHLWYLYSSIVSFCCARTPLVSVIRQRCPSGAEDTEAHESKNHAKKITPL